MRHWPASLLALLLAVFGLGTLPAIAQTTTDSAVPADASQVQPDRSPQGAEDDDFVRSPNDAPLPPLPPPEEGLLERNIPSLREGLGRLPSFFRDMDLNVRLRSFNFNRQNPDDTASEAWAPGGWAGPDVGLAPRHLRARCDVLHLASGVRARGSRRSLLLTSGQGAINVFGQAWAAFRYEDYALLKGYRQRIDDGYVNPQDNRMVPNTFEAGTLSGKLDWLRYDLGYVSAIKPRDSNEFIGMSEQAGAPGGDKGLILSTFTVTPSESLVLYAGNFYALDVFNTAFAKSEYTLPLGEEVKLQFGLQYTDQRSVGEARLGRVRDVERRKRRCASCTGALGTAVHFTGDDASISSPWGTWPGYLSMIVTDFDRADEKAFGVGVRYNFAGTLLPLPYSWIHPLRGVRAGERSRRPRNRPGVADDPGGRSGHHLRRPRPRGPLPALPKRRRGPGRIQRPDGLPHHRELRSSTSSDEGSGTKGFHIIDPVTSATLRVVSTREPGMSGPGEGEGLRVPS